jgi:poly(3-hydroxybutyrate) depolymerase
MSAGCGKTPGIPSSQYNNGQPISITAANKQRRYILSVPTNYDNTHPYRLVVSFHQLDGNDVQNYNWQYYGLLPLAGDTTIFVAPNGQKNGAPCSGMGDGDGGCGWPNSGDSDIALADAVVAQIEENFCVDTNRIFATGWSYGGSMSYQTACARPLGEDNGYIRGVAVYSGSSFISQGPCPPKKQVAYYASHGKNDGVLQYSGGVSMAQDFAKVNGCTWSTPTQATGGHVCTDISGCMEGYPVEFCSFVGDHTPFPDNGQAQGSWGPEEAWKFLSQF